MAEIQIPSLRDYARAAAMTGVYLLMPVLVFGLRSAALAVVTALGWRGHRARRDLGPRDRHAGLVDAVAGGLLERLG
jgi:hypothetical protein